MDDGTSPQHGIAMAATAFQGFLFIQPLTFEKDYSFRSSHKLAFRKRLELRDRDLLSCSAGFPLVSSVRLEFRRSRISGPDYQPRFRMPEIDPKDRDIGSITQQGAMSFLESTAHAIKILYVFFIKS